MDDADAVETLTRLGLSTYEARVFLALQKLGSGSASEVSEICEVPRSQVYGAAEGLERRGLVDVQQGTPTRYRPVSPGDARTRLLEQLETEGERAFEYLDRIQGRHAADPERSEAIWIVEGRENVVDRAVQLIERADSRVVYGTPDAALLDERVVAALADRAADGVDVSVVSTGEDVVATLDGDDVTTHHIPGMSGTDLPSGRTLLADREMVLLSVVPTERTPHVRRETAFWSEDSAFARLLVAVVGGWIGSMLPSFEPSGEA